MFIVLVLVFDEDAGDGDGPNLPATTQILSQNHHSESATIPPKLSLAYSLNPFHCNASLTKGHNDDHDDEIMLPGFVFNVVFICLLVLVFVLAVNQEL